MKEAHVEPLITDDTRVTGKITKLADGYGFIISKDVPYERIFFHWTYLLQDTKRFPELKAGMIVSFVPKKVYDTDNVTGETTYKGYSAIKIRVE